jgi:Cu+-exporting ATPase
MTVTKENAACSYDYNGKTYYFCAASCKDQFVATPDKYLRQ